MDCLMSRGLSATFLVWLLWYPLRLQSNFINCHQICNLNEHENINRENCTALARQWKVPPDHPLASPLTKSWHRHWMERKGLCRWVVLRQSLSYEPILELLSSTTPAFWLLSLLSSYPTPSPGDLPSDRPILWSASSSSIRYTLILFQVAICFTAPAKVRPIVY